MAAFNFQVLTQSPSEIDVISACIGDNTDQASSVNDLGKLVKMGAEQNYVLCAAGDEVEGYLDSVEGGTRGGHSFGGVARRGRLYAVIGAGQGVTPAAVLDYIVADDQVAFGTKPTAAYPAVVKTGTPAKYLWRVIRIVSGDGSAGSVVLLERE